MNLKGNHAIIKKREIMLGTKKGYCSYMSVKPEMFAMLSGIGPVKLFSLSILVMR
jgi:hypothetical protein